MPLAPSPSPGEHASSPVHAGAVGAVRNLTPDSPQYDEQWAHSLPEKNEIRLLLHPSEVGVVIGKGGTNIREVCQQSGARLVVETNEVHAQGERLLRVNGRLDRVAKAVGLVAELIIEGSRARRYAWAGGPSAPAEGQTELLFITHRDLGIDEERRGKLEEISYARIGVAALPASDDVGVWATGEADGLQRLAYALGDVEARELTFPYPQPYRPYDAHSYPRPPCPVEEGAPAPGEAAVEGGASLPLPLPTAPHLHSLPSGGTPVAGMLAEGGRVSRRVPFDPEWLGEVQEWLGSQQRRAPGADIAVTIGERNVHLSGASEVVVGWVQSLEDTLEELRGGEEGEL